MAFNQSSNFLTVFFSFSLAKWIGFFDIINEIAALIKISDKF
jgi:hypothetical protein